MTISAIVPTYTDRKRLAWRTDPPMTAALVREFARRQPRDYPGTIEARGGLLMLSVPEIGRFPNDVKGTAIPIILARELTDAQQRLAAAGGAAGSAADEAQTPLPPPADVNEPDRLRYLYTYQNDLGLPMENIE